MRSIFQFETAFPIPLGAMRSNPIRNINGVTSANPLAVGRSKAFPAPINIGSDIARRAPTINAPIITPGIDPIEPRTMIANAGSKSMRPSSGLIGKIAARSAPPIPEIPAEIKAVLP